MLLNLRKMCWKYNCFVFSYNDLIGDFNYNGFVIYCLDFYLLQLCMKEIIKKYNVVEMSDYISDDKFKGYFYYIEI